MPQVSVIVPVYKVEKYLDKCVRSILAQTLQDIEVILVDDGSPDSCGVLCDAFAAEDSRVKVIHKENGGLSSARNAGIAAATAPYLGFIDSDDYIDPTMYEKLYCAAMTHNADICIGNCYYVDENGVIDTEMDRISPLTDEVLDSRQALQKLVPSLPGGSFYVTAWNKLYRRGLFDSLRFPEGKIHEDEYTVHHLFACSSRIAVLSERLYFYVQRSGSIVNSGVSIKMLDGVHALMDRFRFFRKAHMRPQAKSVLLAAEWKLRSLMPKLPPNAAKPIRKTALTLLPHLVVRLRPETFLLLRTLLFRCKEG